MTTFDERETAFEAKFAHDSEMQFRAESRRNRRIGQWAAELLGKTGEEAETYVRDVMRADLKHHGSEDIIAKLVEDLQGRVAEAEIRNKLIELQAEVRAQMINEF